MSEQDAVTADEDEDLIRAADLYEQCLQEEVTLQGILNLAVLYWQVTDYGLNSALRLPAKFVERAGRRTEEVLQVAAERFPEAEEVTFWQRYIAWADLGEPFDPKECEALIERRPDYGEPLVYLLPATGRPDLRERARAALRAYPRRRTVRARYVASVLESALQLRE